MSQTSCLVPCKRFHEAELSLFASGLGIAGKGAVSLALVYAFGTDQLYEVELLNDDELAVIFHNKGWLTPPKDCAKTTKAICTLEFLIQNYENITLHSHKEPSTTSYMLFEPRLWSYALETSTTCAKKQQVFLATSNSDTIWPSSSSKRYYKDLCSALHSNGIVTGSVYASRNEPSTSRWIISNYKIIDDNNTRQTSGKKHWRSKNKAPLQFAVWNAIIPTSLNNQSRASFNNVVTSLPNLKKFIVHSLSTMPLSDYVPVGSYSPFDARVPFDQIVVFRFVRPVLPSCAEKMLQDKSTRYFETKRFCVNFGTNVEQCKLGDEIGIIEFVIVNVENFQT